MQVSKRKSSLKSDLDSLKDKNVVEERLAGVKKKKLNKEDDVASAEKIVQDDDPKIEDDDHKSSERRISYGSHIAEGKEDHVIAETKTVNGNELGICAIFDAHPGTPNLIENILSEDEFWTNPESAVRRAYEEMAAGGSTTTSVVTAMLINMERLVLANVGGSRGILCKKGENTVEEKEDIINWEVDVRVEEIDEEAKCVVVGSEGIWKVMSNEDVWGCIGEEEEDAAEKVVKMAKSRGSGGDVSCVVVMFN